MRLHATAKARAMTALSVFHNAPPFPNQKTDLPLLGLGGVMSWRIASKTTLNCASYSFSKLAQLPSQLSIGCQDLSQPNESAYNLDIDPDRPPAFTPRKAWQSPAR